MNIGIVLPFETRSDLIFREISIWQKRQRTTPIVFWIGTHNLRHLAVKSLPNKQTRYKMDPAFR
jgi:hypothetical protein